MRFHGLRKWLVIYFLIIPKLGYSSALKWFIFFYYIKPRRFSQKTITACWQFALDCKCLFLITSAFPVKPYFSWNFQHCPELSVQLAYTSSCKTCFKYSYETYFFLIDQYSAASIKDYLFVWSILSQRFSMLHQETYTSSTLRVNTNVKINLCSIPDIYNKSIHLKTLEFKMKLKTNTFLFWMKEKIISHILFGIWLFLFGSKEEERNI